MIHRCFNSKALSSLIRRHRGASIVELLVSIAVLGVAIAGVTDLVWMNTSWTRNFLNKTSASYTSGVFLKRLREDMNAAYKISQTSNGQQLSLWAAHSISKSSINPFPPAASLVSDLITYKLEGSTITRTTGGHSWTVLKGVVGPRKIGSADILIFQYVPKTLDLSDPNFGVQSTASGGARSVLVDVEVLNRDYGKSKSSESDNPLTSDLALRSEFIARNELGMDP